jgi:mRNA-degrading endonuclease RelE of RelBE toxin-antitoxin system
MSADKLLIKMTPVFKRTAKSLLTEEALKELLDHLEINPEKGKLIQKTGGIRKLRWKNGKSNKGKSAGVRVLYHYSKDILVLLITLYKKSEKENITPAERNELKQLIPELISKYRENL